MKLENKKYTAGDLARFYGISVDTVRLYDKKGLLCPYIKDKNNYRLYTRNDLVALEYILRLKHLGISLTDIDDIINHSAPTDVLMLCQQRIEDIDIQITSLSREKENLQHYMSEMSHIDLHSQITVMLNPPFFLKDISKDIQHTTQWLQEHHLLKTYKIASYNELPSTSTDLKSFDSMQMRAEWVNFYLMLSVRENQIPVLQSQIKDSDMIIPSQLCLHGICKANYTDDQIFIDYSRFYEFAQNHNFKLKTKVLGSISFIEDLQNKKTYYCEVWWPIEE